MGQKTAAHYLLNLDKDLWKTKKKDLLKTQLNERLETALIADISFQSKQWALQGVSVTAR